MEEFSQAHPGLESLWGQLDCLFEVVLGELGHGVVLNVFGGISVLGEAGSTKDPGSRTPPFRQGRSC